MKKPQQGKKNKQSTFSFFTDMIMYFPPREWK
jgi:hypothetical protein